MTGIPKVEQETIISFNELEPIAYVYTYRPSYIKRLEKMCKVYPDSCKKGRVDHGGHNYTIPKKYISIKFPKSMTEEQKASLVERAGKMRKAKETDDNK